MGIGIFLGLCFCGFIYLYTQTKDRWNWSKLRKILSYVVITPIVLGLVFWGGLFLYSKYEERPKIITSYKGVKLGDSLNDVKFKVGKFEKFGEWAVNSETLELNKLTKNTKEYQMKFKEVHDLISQNEEDKLKNKGYEEYIDPTISLKIELFNNKVNYINYLCSDNDYSSSVNNISCKSSGDEILEKFSDEVRILCSSDKDDLRRLYDTIKYGIRYILRKNEVIGFFITEPKILESHIGHDWIKCE